MPASRVPTPTATSRVPSSRACSTCWPAATPRRSSPSFARAWSGTASRASYAPVPTRAGSIPDRGLYGVHLVENGSRVGELDEEMVYEARQGEVFQLGASSWRIEQITRDRVLVSPAPGVPGKMPFWKGDGVGRPSELGRAVGEATRTRRFGDLDPLAAR